MNIEIPGYEIISELGQGAMGTVFLALQESLQRKVALKVLHVWLTNDPSFRERFMKEGRIVARLKHNNIVTVHDISHHEDRYYMDLEYAGGGTLSDRIAQGVGEKEAIRIIVEIARALSYAHKHDFIHRDIKPENILFRDDGTPLISDFGIAKAMTGNTQLTVAGSAIGTPDYMSPEQAMGGEVSAQSDIYSLGVTFYPQGDEVDADQLLRQSDQAMYQAKLAGKNRYHIFDTEHDRTLRGRHGSLERIGEAFRKHPWHYSGPAAEAITSARKMGAG